MVTSEVTSDRISNNLDSTTLSVGASTISSEKILDIETKGDSYPTTRDLKSNSSLDYVILINGKYVCLCQV